MSRSPGFNAGPFHIQSIHENKIPVGIILCNFHRFKLLKPCFLCDLVLAFIQVLLKMAYIGNVPYISHLIPEML